LYPSGRVNISCSGCLSNGAAGPTLNDGKSVSLGPFRCTALALDTGVRCVIKATGRGFQLDGKRGVPKRIGGG